jgi:mono/diheme cytochrome c family protein
MIIFPLPMNHRHHIALVMIAAGLQMAGLRAAHAAPDGKALFLKNCAPCHGPDGRAQTPIARRLGVKDLTQSQTSDADIARQIREGVKDSKGNSRMPSFQDRFTAEEIESLVQHVKSLRKPGSEKKD